MTYEEVKYELQMMSSEEINSWMVRNYGETVESLYGVLPREELIHQIASNNAQ